MSHKKISTIIITFNEEHIIGDTLDAALQVSNDIHIIDSGSTDRTLAIASDRSSVYIHHHDWLGYSEQKNWGTQFAKYDYIMSLDADEILSADIIQSINSIPSITDYEIYEAKYLNNFCGVWIHYGEWGNDTSYFLFNKHKIRWDDQMVHERLLIPPDTRSHFLKGSILHYTVRDIKDYILKQESYTTLAAQKMHENGISVHPLRKYFSPLFRFLRDYVFRLGFLDGKAGLQIAYGSARYVYLKYKKLQEMNESL